MKKEEKKPTTTATTTTKTTTSNQHVRTRELNRKHCVQFTILNSYIDIDQLYFLL